MARDIVLVTGGTGNIGSAFVSILASDARAPLVRAVSRDARSAGARLVTAYNPETVRATPFDVNDPPSMRAAFDGVTKLLVIAPFVSDMGAWHEKVASVAKDVASLEHIVKVSVTGARSPDHDPPPGRIPFSHWQGEEALRSTGKPTTVIRPTIFMQHFLNTPGLYTRGDDRVFLPTGDGKVAWLDCRDIAAFAAALVLASPEASAAFVGGAFELTGPRAHTAAELVEILSLVAGRPFKHVDGVAAFSARCAELGVPDMIKGVYGEAAGGWFSKIEDDAFARLTGRHTSSFARFAADHAAHFGGGGRD